METAAHSLVGCRVIEIGRRQAWPFVGFRGPDERETRLYLDADWHVTAEGFRVPPAHPLLLLADLDGLTVTSAVTDEHRTLTLGFRDGRELVVSGEPEEYTTDAPWWLTPWR